MESGISFRENSPLTCPSNIEASQSAASDAGSESESDGSELELDYDDDCPCSQCIDPYEDFDSSHVRHIISSNQAPMASEIQCIEETLEAGKSHRKRLMSRIVELTSLINKHIKEHERLTDAREALDEDLLLFRGSMSVLRRVPTEVLSIIFTYAADPSERYGDHPPWTVSQVSRQWRAIALAQPLLWNEVVIDSQQSWRFRRAPILRLELQLSRAASVPLQVVLRGQQVPMSSYYGFSRFELFSRMVETVMAQSNRWGSIVVDTDLFNPRGSLLARIRGNVDNLRTLTWILDCGRVTGGPPIDAFEIAPKLEEVHIHDTTGWSRNSDGCREGLRLNAPGLTVYSARTSWEHHLTALKSSSTNLVECFLAVPGPIVEQAEIIDAPNLRRVATTDAGLLNHFRAPALEAIYCISRDNQLSQFLQTHPGLPLKTAVLLFPASVADITATLHAAPELQHFGVCVRPELLDTLHRLLTLGPGRRLAPGIEQLFIGQRDRTESRCWDEDLCRKMVESRWRQGSLRDTLVPMRDPWADLDWASPRGGDPEPEVSWDQVLSDEGLTINALWGWTADADQWHMKIVPQRLNRFHREELTNN
ncbi:unnamed protein product [Mycena citricolor]|uniref:F-box domain-containing protein n=1 Tax=Mycena citricolor TaxID=2018698 RepID=A0AAD2H170_9AGAR|nr:unnamed protein product [Mycena citricolor]